jgi:5-methylthioribose kinase
VATETGQRSYRMLDTAGLVGLLEGLGSRVRLGGAPSDWRIREVGDGNLNLVFLIDGPEGSVCVKQALPYVRAAGPSWPMSLERAFFENAYFRAVAPHVGSRIPEIFHYDPVLYCTVMECLSSHIILRQGLIAGRRYPQMAQGLGEYVARACFWTSNFALPCEAKLEAQRLFAANQALTRISVDLIFCDPYRFSKRNRHTAPQLDSLVAEIRGDSALKLAASRMGLKFMTQSEALLHGDLHSGSVMVSAEDFRVIDPEFALYGPIGFDLGAFFGNLLLNWFAQPGHATLEDDRSAQQEWLWEQAVAFWNTFRATFLQLWAETGDGDAYPGALWTTAQDRLALQAARHAYLEHVFADMLGFAACKMIRRIIGFAHVQDFESIREPVRRAQCEAGALAVARILLTHPQQFTSLDALSDALPRAGR